MGSSHRVPPRGRSPIARAFSGGSELQTLWELHSGSRRRLRQQAGFTMLELMIVVAIIMVLTAAGIGMSSDMVPRYRTRRAAKEFVAKVQQCRALAIRSNRECSVWMVSADGSLSDVSTNGGEYWVAMGDASNNSTNWDILPVDSMSDGSDDDSSLGIIDIGDTSSSHYARHVSISPWNAITGPGVGNNNRIVFDPRGFVRNPVGDFDSNGYISITFVNKKARKNGTTEDFVVDISRAGMTRLSSTVNPVYDSLTSGTTES